MRIRGQALTCAGTPIRVAVLQGNILQDQKWDPAMRDAIMQRYIDMTREAIGRNAQFILWPESATPLPYEQDVARGELIRRLAREAHVTLLIGSDQVEPVTAGRGRRSRRRARLYNAAYLIQPDGSTAAIYRKIHLVPFGEYVPVQPAAVFRRPAGRGRVGLHARHRGDAAAGRRAHGQHRDLLRGDLPEPDARRSSRTAASC